MFIVSWSAENQRRLVFNHNFKKLLHSRNWIQFSRRRRRGGKARIVRSYSRVTKFFVAGCAGGFEGVVRAVMLALGGAAASGGAMVEEGGSVIDPRRLA